MRLREIDFLRGIAVILVLFRHAKSFEILEQIGWIGVDLFFVLSGFLVSGLLFHEYKKYNEVNLKSFLIRRGFKIYPLFYASLFVTVAVEQYFYQGVDKQAFWGEVFFIQNYYKSIWYHTWTLAVEEHFYLAVALFILWIVKTDRIKNVRFNTYFFLSIFVICLTLRIINTGLPYTMQTHLMATHVRIDSLLFGVALSYFYSFRREQFISFFQRYRKRLYLAAGVCLMPPFFLLVQNQIMNSIGMTLLYLGFGVILSNFITDPRINDRLNRLMGKPVVDFIGVVGYASYPIYLLHLFVFFNLTRSFPNLGYWPTFLVYFGGSITLGLVVSKTFEKWVLAFRDKYFPKKARAVPTPLTLSTQHQ